MKNFKEDVFTFGKYKGQHIDEVEDKEYLEWLVEDGELDITDDITEIFSKNVEDRLVELL